MDMPAHAEEKVGTVSFAISCAASSRAPFERGIALLHSFRYDDAEKQFVEIAADDPGCAMAYWGEALCLYRQLWFVPTNAELGKAWELMQKARAAKESSPRERAYIEALALFYEEGTTVPHEKRATAFSNAMEGVYRSYPDDTEAAVFYALSLLSSSAQSDLQLAPERHAVAILSVIFEKYPDHPGIAHYLIHACDNPQMAELGLPAARKYAAIAPGSPHALHMPGHIFARLGLWQEDVDSNLASEAAAAKLVPVHSGAEHRLHAMDFLEYAYLQMGDVAAARAIVAKAAGVPEADMDPGFGDYLGYMHAHFPALFALEMHDWIAGAALAPPADAEPQSRAVTYWAQAVGAGHLHDAGAARNAAAQYDAMVELVQRGEQPGVAKTMTTNRDEARAWAEFADGKVDAAIALLRPIADRQEKVGKGEVELPAREMLADMLLDRRRAAEALAEYERTLRSDPNRFNDLYGAARAAQSIGNTAKACEYYAQLLKICGASANDSERAELAAARKALAAPQSN